MRQRLDLFIDGLLADTDGDSLVLFNYSLEDLRNPAVVKNSYSRQLTLKATKRNNRIFQSCFRMDRVIGGGFDPRKRVPFQILADGGRLVEAGYLKLDSTENSEHANYYKVTLYGELGAFFFALAYRGEDKLTLADLDYLGTADPDNELNFNINARTVWEAWSNLEGNFNFGDGQNEFPRMEHWSEVINFAPCYNGLPKNFDTKHAFVEAAEAGLETDVEDPDSHVHYTPRNGYALVDLGQDLTEWQVRDFRAYLQRPVVSVYAIIKAIQRMAVTLGYKIELGGEFFSKTNPYFVRSWMSLAMLNDLVKDKVTYSGQTRIGHGRGSAPVNQSSAYPFSIPNGTTPTMQNLYDVIEIATGYEPTAADEIVAQIPLEYTPTSLSDASLPAGEKLWLSARGSGLAAECVIVVETYGFDANDNVIVRGPIKGYASKILQGGQEWGIDFEAFANAAGWQPLYIAQLPDYEFGDLVYGHFEARGDGSTAADWVGPKVVATLNGKGIAKIRIHITYIVSGHGSSGKLYRDRENYNRDVSYTNYMRGAEYGSYKVIVDGSTRTDTPITKKDLLSLDMTPADFLLYYARRYGLMFRTGADGKTIRVESRWEFFKDEVHDIDDRIAVERGNAVAPLPFDARILQMKEEPIDSAYMKVYEARYGRPYGSKRLNTGYEFNADTKDIFSKSVFKTAAEVKKQDVTFVSVYSEVTDELLPSAFLLGGMKYYLFTQQGTDRTELNVPAVSEAAQLVYLDPIYQGYDKYSRPEFQDADNNPVDAVGVLLFLQDFMAPAPGFAITDDNPLMYTLSDGPCWYLNPRYGNNYYTNIPLFGRYLWNGTDVVTMQMDFGTPAEIDIPGAFIQDGSDVYARFWDAYIADRYNKDTKTVTLSISTRGLPMSIEQMRPFFWFRGSLWTLNKIIDYDITGDGITKCEFVQVQDPANYRKQMIF